MIEGYQIYRLDEFLVAYLTISLSHTPSPVSVTHNRFPYLGVYAVTVAPGIQHLQPSQLIELSPACS